MSDSENISNTNTTDTTYTDPATVLSTDTDHTTNTSPATEPSPKSPAIIVTGSPTGAHAATATDTATKTNSESNIAASATTKPGKGTTNNCKTSKANGSNTKNTRAPVTRSRTVSSNSPVVSDSTRSKTKSNLPNYLHTPKQSGTSLLSPSTSNSRPTNNNSRMLMPENFREFESNLLAKFKNLLSIFEQNMKDEINNTITALCSRVEQCERDIYALRQENEKIRDQLDDSQRQQRLSDVIVSGLPLTSNKSPVDLVKQIANKLQHTLTPHFDAFRLRSQNQRDNCEAPLLIRLSSPAEKKALLTAFQINKGLTVSQLFSNEDLPHTTDTNTWNRRIYINESLTPQNSALMRHALQLRREGILFSVRSKNGFIFVKKSSDDTEIKIQSSTLSTINVPQI